MVLLNLFIMWAPAGAVTGEGAGAKKGPFAGAGAGA